MERNDDLISRSALIRGLQKGTIITDDIYGLGIMNGIDYAIRLVNDAPSVDAVEVVHARWVKRTFKSDGYEHHVCSACGKPAPFWPIEGYDYDEMLDGEWDCIGVRQTSINELLTKHCPNCGKKMRSKTKRRRAEYV